MRSQGLPGGPVVRAKYFHWVAQLQSLTRALRFHKPLGVAKKKKEKENEITDAGNGNTDKLLIHLGDNTQHAGKKSHDSKKFQ